MKKADENKREFTVLCLINSFCILVVEWFIFQVVFVIQDGSKKKLWNNPAKNITVHCSLISRHSNKLTCARSLLDHIHIIIYLLQHTIVPCMILMTELLSLARNS